jgi:small subunit ribosomal protein S6
LGSSEAGGACPSSRLVSNTDAGEHRRESLGRIAERRYGTLKKYEGMFLFDPTVATDWEAMLAELNRLLDRAGARVIVINKWDERRLAFEIRGRKRGTYALAFFEAEQAKIAELERDVRLSEPILRCMVLDADHLTEDEIKEIAARPCDHSAAEAERIGTQIGRAHV